jgi:hypothetical protein
MIQISIRKGERLHLLPVTGDEYKTARRLERLLANAYIYHARTECERWIAEALTDKAKERRQNVATVLGIAI